MPRGLRGRQLRLPELDPAWDTQLYPAEIEALRGAARGETTKETAARLWKSHWTVQSQRKRLLGKLQAKTMAQAVAIAYERKILP
jgi:DNA-binding CsgD family transcriptional regulator